MKKMFFLFLALCSLVFGKSLSEIRNSGVIRIGVLTEHAPFSQLKDGVFEGFEIEFSKNIAKGLFGEKGGKVDFIATDMNQRMEFLENNKVDLVVAILSITEEREKRIDFSMPYFSVNLGVLTRKNDSVNSIASLRSKTILVEDGTIAQDYLNKNGYNTTPCFHSGECYKMLKDGKADAYANDNIIVLTYPVVDRTVEVNIKNLGNYDFLGIGVQKGNSELLAEVNNQLIRLSKEGFFKKAFEETLDPFYKGTAERKYFLLDDIYNSFTR
ncbi:MAG: transporter substrate-binding domain-containing protein [Campylobacteraceae bacterium]|nr:transporter substrate-binding domain-containing protein [Campylobacteraceae bacterium]